MSDPVTSSAAAISPETPPPPTAPRTAPGPDASDEHLSPLRELILSRIRGFLREPEALFWTFGFPIIMAIGLGLAFRDNPGERAVVGVERGSAAERWTAALRASPDVDVRVLDPAAAALALRKGTVGVLLAGTGRLVYRYDPARPESRLARLTADAVVQKAGGATRPVAAADDRSRRPGGRYIDWVIPGLIGLNLMSTGMWGIGFGIVQARQRKQLKRLVSTPMRKRDFMLAQVLARLVFIGLEVPPIVLFAWLAFGVHVAGSLPALSAVVVLGAMTFAGMGLLCAARARTMEGISGILNVVMLPMFVLSGVFFSAARYPDAVQPFIRALPLTALNDALRAVYNDGLPLSAAAVPLAILAAWGVASFAAALKAFRWQ
ncbi:MAG: Transport permease protein [Gemmatimonadetes bacterium]|nr:Transport permease protein [Gemmatimonadota bacterium]